MSIEEFRKLAASEEPPELPAALLALLYDARGDWESAHEAAQALATAEGAWIHAYLHRKEGDPGNAGYWYRRAGRPMPRCTPEVEWEQIAGELLGRVEAP
jgi:hypothetical protein